MIGTAEVIEFHCTWCKEPVGIVAFVQEWDMWFSPDRPMVQRCFPDMSAENREMLVSGTCPACWDSMFGGME